MSARPSPCTMTHTPDDADPVLSSPFSCFTCNHMLSMPSMQPPSQWHSDPHTHQNYNTIATFTPLTRCSKNVTQNTRKTRFGQPKPPLWALPMSGSPSIAANLHHHHNGTLSRTQTLSHHPRHLRSSHTVPRKRNPQHSQSAVCRTTKTSTLGTRELAHQLH